MADMDVYEQVAGFHTELQQQTGRRATKFTMASDVHDWFVQLASTVNAPDYEPTSIITLMGVPFAIDDEFWPGQLRIHHADGFVDHYVILPITLPGHAFFVNAVDEHLREILGDLGPELPDPSVTSGAAFAARYAPFRGSSRPLSTIRDLTIQPPDA